jgi:hypothetical protein
MHYAKLFRTLALAACTLTALSACAASASGGAEAGATAGAPRADRNTITQAELAASGATNLLDAVQRLRPQWLRGVNLTNREGMGSDFAVYQGTTPLGGIEALRQLAPGYPLRLRYLDASQATNTLPARRPQPLTAGSTRAPGASHPGRVRLYWAPRGFRRSPGAAAGGPHGEALRDARDFANFVACNRLGTDSSTGRAGDS